MIDNFPMNKITLKEEDCIFLRDSVRRIADHFGERKKIPGIMYFIYKLLELSNGISRLSSGKESVISETSDVFRKRLHQITERQMQEIGYENKDVKLTRHW